VITEAARFKTVKDPFFLFSYLIIVLSFLDNEKQLSLFLLPSEYNKRSNRLDLYLSKLKSSLKRNEVVKNFFLRGVAGLGDKEERKGLVGTLSSAERLAWPDLDPRALLPAPVVDLSNASSCHSRR
jgi:hypothetical protein